MKIRVFIITAALIIGNIITPNVLAVNLTDVYKQALSNDPAFKAARAQWLADRETLPINRADLFPTLGAKGSTSRSRIKTDTLASTTLKGYRTSSVSSYSIMLSQPLFDFGIWAKVWQAQATVKRAEVTFLAAAEDLLLRTAKAYFNVLQAKDMLSYTKANREALERTLNQTKHKYAVGLIAITDLENAKADYDDVVAKEIAATNDLSINFEKLSEITDIRYLSLDQVKENFPLLSPQPADIERWAKAAEQQNFTLAAKRYATIEARENIKIQNAGHLPTLGANGNYTYNYQGNYNDYGVTENDRGITAGLVLNVPLFQGGKVLAAVRRANYQYQQAISDQETTHRSTVSLTRQAYLTVLSNISQIKARKQAIKSAQSSLHATIAGYEAGTRTMVEVLQEQANLYNRQKDFAVSEYAYITQLLTLKQLTGILDADDFIQINSWLKKPDNTQTSSNVTKKENKPVKKQVIAAAKTNTTQTEASKKINAAKPTIEQPAATNLQTSSDINNSTKPITSTPTTNISANTQSNSNIKPTTSVPTVPTTNASILTTEATIRQQATTTTTTSTNSSNTTPINSVNTVSTNNVDHLLQNRSITKNKSR